MLNYYSKINIFVFSFDSSGYLFTLIIIIVT